MSYDSNNDNSGASVETAPLELHVELAHATNALMAHEVQIKRCVMVMLPPPHGPKPLGEIIMRLGQALLDKKNAEEERKPRIILPPSILRP